MQTQTITANGLVFAYYEQGTGHPIICLHGFPDTADTWRDLMPRLADAGYRVVAPFMRGYPPSTIPVDGSYNVNDLAHDVVGLMDAFGFGQATIIGQDWGALAAYAAAALAPDRVDKLVTVAIPHPRTLRFGPRTLWAARHFITFQRRKSSAKWMRRNNYAAIGNLFKRWSPGWAFTDADVDPVRKAYAQPGAVEAALGYYWSFFGSRDDPDVQDLLRAKTSVPTLMMLGIDDGALPPDRLPDQSRAFTGDFQQINAPGAGHFLHREKPDLFAEHVLSFLSS